MADLKDRGSDDAVSRDWITIWQSELSALATDRERQEAWSRLVAIWARAGQSLVQLFGSSHQAPEPAAAATDAEAGPASSAAPPGPASPLAASEPDRQQLARLAERVAELERQLAALGPSTGRP